MAASMDLKLNRDLIFPNFEGYKLSLDKLPTYETGIDNGLYKVELGDDQFYYHHAKLFGVYNHLTIDPWQAGSVYYIDSSWNIIKAAAHDTSISCGPALWKIPDASNQQLVPGRVQATLRLVSQDLCMVCDGAGQIYIVDTAGRREGDEKWTMVPQERTPCLLVDAVEVTGEGENHTLECLLAHVSEATPEEKDKYRSQYLTVLEWVTFSSVDRKSWTLERSRQLISRKPFSYASLGHGDGCLTVAGEADFIFTRDSEIPVVSDEEKEVENTDKASPEYTWTQTLEDVTVQFTVPPGVGKADIYLTLRPDSLDFGVKNTRDLLKGQLHAAVDTDGSTWTIEGQRVDLCLSKQSEAMWPVVVEGDTRGEMLADPTEVAVIHERLAHLTSEEWNPDPTRSDKPYNTQELEDCDMFPDDNFQLARIDGNSHKLTHKDRESSSSSMSEEIGRGRSAGRARRGGGRGRVGRGGGRVGRRAGRRGATGRGRSPSVEESQASHQFRLSDEQRKERVKGLIEQMTEARAKEVLCLVVDNQPGIILNILDRIEPPQPSGYHPPPSTSSPAWCRCTRCREMPTELERVCCNQWPENCISQLPDMEQFILHEGVLALARTYRKEILVYPVDIDLMKANRHASYRQFIMWQHGVLGAGVRRVIPSCCVWVIRDRFPDPFGQYAGFLPARLG